MTIPVGPIPPWRAEIRGPRLPGRLGYDVKITNGWMSLQPTFWAWTLPGARRCGARLARRQNRRDYQDERPEVVEP